MAELLLDREETERSEEVFRIVWQQDELVAQCWILFHL